jgi:nitrite reductase (NADH) large subunit
MQRKIVIIGSSSAGISAAEAARRQDPQAEIVILSHDRFMPYYRLRICEILSDRGQNEKLFLHPVDWYAERSLDIRLNQSVVSLDPLARTLYLADGHQESYDRLIIASGSQSFIPPVEGISRAGVHVLWTMQDALNVAEALSKARRVIVVGGGLLGLEAAYYASQADCQVAIIERNPTLLANQLDDAGSQVFLDQIRGLGIEVLLSAELRHIMGTSDDESSPVQRVILADGRLLEADLVLVCIGVRANIGFVDNTPIAVQRRIAVNEQMETSVPDIYACGDAAEVDGAWFGLWSVARAQGLVAGANAAGGSQKYEKSIPPYVVNTMGTKIVAQGDKGVKGDAHYEYDVQLQEEKGIYRKLVYRDGILCGFILIGDTSEFTQLQKQVGKARSA